MTRLAEVDSMSGKSGLMKPKPVKIALNPKPRHRAFLLTTACREPFPIMKVRPAAVLRKINHIGLKLNQDECELSQAEVIHFGHLFGEIGIRLAPEKVKAVAELPPPTNVSELLSIFEIFNYLRRFVNGLRTIMKPVSDLLKYDTAFQWGNSQQRAFESVKKNITKSPPPKLTCTQLSVKVRMRMPAVIDLERCC